MGRFFANKVSDPAELDDLVAETFRLCAHSLGKFRGDSSFRTYLYGIARNVLRGYVRTRGRLPQDPDFSTSRVRDLGPSPSSVAVRRQEERLLLDALRAIPLDYQIVLELAFFEDMSRSQIAETLGLPAGTVASRLRKARELLRSEIEAIAQSPELLEATVTGVDDWARNVRETLEGEATSSEDHPAT